MLAPQFKQIPLSQIRWRSQVRQHPEADQESLVALSQTIKTRGGVLQSICVYVDGDGYEGICGQRRSLAAAMAGISTVPAMVWPTVPSREELAEIQLIENTHRMPLRPIEHATALRGLISLSGTTATEIARRLGLSDASVSRSLKLLELPEAIRVQVDNGEISGAVAYEISQVSDPVRQAELAAHAAVGNLTRDEITRRRKASQTDGTETAGAPSRVTVKVTGGRSITVSAANLNLNSLIVTLEEVLNRAREANRKKLTLSTFRKMQLDQSKSDN